MSKYSNLRWKIADLEKDLEKEKNYSSRLLKDLERYVQTIYEQDKIIDGLKQMIKEQDKGGDERIHRELNPIKDYPPYLDRPKHTRTPTEKGGEG